MKLLAKCPGCLRPMELDFSDADKRKQCPRCGRLFKVPDTEHLQKAIQRLDQAHTTVYVDERGNCYA